MISEQELEALSFAGAPKITATGPELKIFETKLTQRI